MAIKVKRRVIKGRILKGHGALKPGQEISLDGPLARALDDLGITEPIRKTTPAAEEKAAAEEED